MNVSATGAAGRIRLHLRTIASRSCSAIGRRLLRGGPGWSCRWRRRAIARRCSGVWRNASVGDGAGQSCRRVWARSWKWSRRMRWKRSADRRPSRSEARALAISIDGVHVGMRKEKVARGQGVASVPAGFREASSGTVSLFDGDGGAPAYHVSRPHAGSRQGHAEEGRAGGGAALDEPATGPGRLSSSPTARQTDWTWCEKCLEAQRRFSAIGMLHSISRSPCRQRPMARARTQAQRHFERLREVLKEEQKGNDKVLAFAASAAGPQAPAARSRSHASCGSFASNGTASDGLRRVPATRAHPIGSGNRRVAPTGCSSLSGSSAPAMTLVNQERYRTGNPEPARPVEIRFAIVRWTWNPDHARHET